MKTKNTYIPQITRPENVFFRKVNCISLLRKKKLEVFFTKMLKKKLKTSLKKNVNRVVSLASLLRKKRVLKKNIFVDQ